MSFQTKIDDSSKRTGSNIVLALDFPVCQPRHLLVRSFEMIDLVFPYVCAVKVNHQLVLPLGLFDGVKKIIDLACNHGLPIIMDCKINDVGYTNKTIAEYYFKAGFDAVIANPFVGWYEGLQPVFEVARQMQRGVILLILMSHKGSKEGYGQTVQDPKTGKQTSQYTIFARKAVLWKADGAIVGATYPQKIVEVHKVLKDLIPIYTPGIGPQGGTVESAIKAGARYLIVGRAITLSKNPVNSAIHVRDIANR